MSKERATPVDRRLVAMQERIEELERTCQDHGEIQAALCKQIDALQADNERLREVMMPLVRHRHTTNDSEYRAAEKALATTTEQSLARLRNQVLEFAADIASRQTYGTEAARQIRITKEPE